MSYYSQGANELVLPDLFAAQIFLGFWHRQFFPNIFRRTIFADIFRFTIFFWRFFAAQNFPTFFAAQIKLDKCRQTILARHFSLHKIFRRFLQWLKT
jgi:hypothetical protein